MLDESDLLESGHAIDVANRNGRMLIRWPDGSIIAVRTTNATPEEVASFQPDFSICTPQPSKPKKKGKAPNAK